MKIKKTKKTSAIFLAIVLVTGTIALSSPSFMITGAAQAQPYYGGMDSYDDRKSYGMDKDRKSYGEDIYGPEYSTKYTDSNSYEPTDYTDKNSYEPTTSYGNDKNYQKTYGNDNSYESQYQSYKPDYKPKYSSYDGKDDRDKSKDSSKSISLNKIKCININLNINGNNAGNVSIGNKEQGYLGAYSSAGGGYGGEGYSKQGKGFDCVINNNNNNTNINLGGGNQTISSGPLTCEECFTRHLTPQQIDELLPIQGSRITIETIERLCASIFLADNEMEAANLEALISDNTSATQEQIDALIDCLRDSGVFDPRPPINR